MNFRRWYFDGASFIIFSRTVSHFHKRQILFLLPGMRQGCSNIPQCFSVAFSFFSQEKKKGIKAIQLRKCKWCLNLDDKNSVLTVILINLWVHRDPLKGSKSSEQRKSYIHIIDAGLCLALVTHVVVKWHERTRVAVTSRSTLASTLLRFLMKLGKE